jgi:phospholipase C
MIVVLENENESNAIDQPFMKSLAARGAYLESYTAITHPSQPNYIAMTAGDLHGVKDNENVDLDVRHLGDLLEAKGLSWKVYAEGYPGNCRLDARIGSYARKHVPFISFESVQEDPARCAKIVDASRLYDDLAAGALPDYSLFIPDMNNDGHDTGVEFADRWLGATFRPLLEDPRFMKDMLFVVTFDESRLGGGNRIYTAFYGDAVVAGSVSEYPWNHYSLLRTIEEAFDLGTLGLNDQSAAPISGIWR